MLFFSHYFLIEFQKEFSCQPSLDKAGVLSICVTKPTWTVCWFPLLQFSLKTCKDEAFLSSSGNSSHTL